MILTGFVILLFFTISFIFWKYPAISRSRTKVYSNEDKLVNKLAEIFVPVLLISLLIGLRYDVGVDYMSYKHIYENFFKGSLKDVLNDTELEPLYVLISYICYNIKLPYYVFFTIMAFIPFIFYYKSFKGISYLFPYSIYFVASLTILFWYFNIQRQAISFFILLYAVTKIKEKKFFAFLFWDMIASGFHVSAIYFFPCFFLYYLPIKRKIPIYALIFLYLITWIFGSKFQSIFFNILLPFLTGRYADYITVMENWVMEGGTGIGLFLLHVVDLILIVTSSTLFLRFHKERYDIYFRIYYIGALIANIAGTNMLLSRLPFSFTSMKIMVAAFFIYHVFTGWKSEKTMMKLGAVSLLFISMLLLLANIRNTPYQFVFS